MVNCISAAGLTPDQFEVASRYYHDGATATTIAGERECSVRAVRKLIAKVKRRLARAGLPEPTRTKEHSGHMRNISESLMRQL